MSPMLTDEEQEVLDDAVHTTVIVAVLVMVVLVAVVAAGIGCAVHHIRH